MYNRCREEFKFQLGVVVGVNKWLPFLLLWICVRCTSRCVRQFGDTSAKTMPFVVLSELWVLCLSTCQCCNLHVYPAAVGGVGGVWALVRDGGGSSVKTWRGRSPGTRIHSRTESSRFWKHSRKTSNRRWLRQHIRLDWKCLGPQGWQTRAVNFDGKLFLLLRAFVSVRGRARVYVCVWWIWSS